MTYIELHALSAFSFLEGASVPEELVAAALALEMPAMALLDLDGFYGSPRFHLSAKKNGIKAHIGAEITVQSHDLVQSPKSKVQSQKQDRQADI
jgi:error-prone DNA polymerase